MTPSDDLSDVAAAAAACVRRFLQAFEALDLPAFLACFTEDATAFFPVPEPTSRFDGRAAIGAQFEHVFAAIRAGAASGPPFHRLEPEGLAVQVLSPDAVVVSFHLRNSARLARRTLALRRIDGQWRIAHLHASNAPVPVDS